MNRFNKTILSIAFLIFTFIKVSGQPFLLNEIKEYTVKKYLESFKKGKNAYYIEMNFGESNIEQPIPLSAFKTHNIDSIHLIYTDYPKNRDFTKLNTNRLTILFDSISGLNRNHENISWKVFEQTGCKSLEEAKDYYHGFIIYTKKPLKLHGNHTTDIQKKYLDRKFYSAVIRKLGSVNMNVDSVSSCVLERNNWKNIVIISDWTGSMYPYTLQVLKWQIDENKHDNIVGYVFFNDGDHKEEHEKKIGTTGGLYHTTDSKIYHVLNKMKEVQKNGDGGELEENDLEAILYAQSTFPDANEFILIADNLSKIRDISLQKKIEKPVRIILSKTKLRGKEYPINKQYIELALTTNGSLHTIEKDYLNKKEILKLKEQLKSNPKP